MLCYAYLFKLTSINPRRERSSTTIAPRCNADQFFISENIAYHTQGSSGVTLLCVRNLKL